MSAEPAPDVPDVYGRRTCPRRAPRALLLSADKRQRLAELDKPPPGSRYATWRPRTRVEAAFELFEEGLDGGLRGFFYSIARRTDLDNCTTSPGCGLSYRQLGQRNRRKRRSAIEYGAQLEGYGWLEPIIRWPKGLRPSATSKNWRNHWRIRIPPHYLPEEARAGAAVTAVDVVTATSRPSSADVDEPRDDASDGEDEPLEDAQRDIDVAEDEPLEAEDVDGAEAIASAAAELEELAEAAAPRSSSVASAAIASSLPGGPLAGRFGVVPYVAPAILLSRPSAAPLVARVPVVKSGAAAPPALAIAVSLKLDPERSAIWHRAIREVIDLRRRNLGKLPADFIDELVETVQLEGLSVATMVIGLEDAADKARGRGARLANFVVGCVKSVTNNRKVRSQARPIVTRAEAAFEALRAPPRTRDPP